MDTGSQNNLRREIIIRMSSKNYQWLPHLENSLTDGVKGYSVSLYSIALEGWRRGLELTFIKTKTKKSTATYELSDGEKTHRFTSTRGDLVSREAMRICKDKARTKEYLLASNVPTPHGREFSKDIPDSDIIKYAKEVGYPLVVKPIDGTGGKGVIAGIESENELKEALDYVRKSLDYPHVLVEEHFEGEDFRVYVIGDQVISATKRIPANVRGDGTSTIKELIQKKNNSRKETKFYRSSLIKIDQELKSMIAKKGYSLDSVPNRGELVYLKTKNNITSGGDPVDGTDELTENIKEIAINAVKSIPNLIHAGVDILFNKELNRAVVIEINSQPNTRLSLFPLEGKARDIPKAIIDYYFPKTEQNLSCPLYFDYDSVWKEIRDGSSKRIKIPNVPRGDLVLKRFKIKGSVRRAGYAQWIKRNAISREIHGYANHLSNGVLSVVVCGTKDKITEFTNVLKTQSPDTIELSEVKIVEKIRKTPVAIGFKIINDHLDMELKDGYYPAHLKDPGRRSHTKRQASKLRKPSKNIKKIDYEKEYYKLLNSTSWKITRPVRKLGAFIKKIKNK